VYPHPLITERKGYEIMSPLGVCWASRAHPQLEMWVFLLYIPINPHPWAPCKVIWMQGPYLLYPILLPHSLDCWLLTGCDKEAATAPRRWL